MMASVATFMISHDDDRITYRFNERPTRRFHVRPGDEVTFQSDLPFAVQFSGLSPFTRFAHPTRTQSYTLKVSQNATAGIYKFSVALLVDRGVLIDDPEVVVDRTEDCSIN
jgi:hypothetical protein